MTGGAAPGRSATCSMRELTGRGQSDRADGFTPTVIPMKARDHHAGPGMRAVPIRRHHRAQGDHRSGHEIPRRLAEQRRRHPLFVYSGFDRGPRLPGRRGPMLVLPASTPTARQTLNTPRTRQPNGRTPDTIYAHFYFSSAICLSDPYWDEYFPKRRTTSCAQQPKGIGRRRRRRHLRHRRRARHPAASVMVNCRSCSDDRAMIHDGNPGWIHLVIGD